MNINKKNSLLIGILLGFTSGSFAQINQTALTPILQDAKEFAEKSIGDDFDKSIEKLLALQEVDILKPETLNQTNRTLLISAIITAFENNIIKNYTKNLSLFFDFLKYESENNDDKENCHWLGYMYMEGLGVTQNYTTAKYWYEKAIEKGYGKAMNNLGIMYHFGLGVAENYNTASYWYQKAANLGEASAMYIIGIMYQEGEGVTQNYSTAVNWFKKAAQNGSKDAQDYCKENGITW